MADYLDADVERYLQAAALNIAPPPLPSDPLVGGITPIEQLLRVLGLAANADDPTDNADSAEQHARRDAWTTEAAGAFTEQDGGAAQQLPAVFSSVAGALSGAVSGLLQPLGQFPQLLAQAAEQAVQATTALVNRGGVDEPAPVDEPVDDLADESPSEAMDFAETTVPGPIGPAVPAAAPVLPPPAASPATYPSAATGVPFTRTAVAAPAPVPLAPMTGMPMMPPAGLPGTGTDSRTDTKRVAVGPVTDPRKPVAQRRIRNAATAEPS